MIQVELISHTPDPELTIAVASRTCYANEDHRIIREKLTDADINRILMTIITKGHHSVLEHASFTFSMSGVSRVLTHQLVRHRMASYSQLSQQRTDSSCLDFVIPPDIKDDLDLCQEYCEMMGRCQELYKRILHKKISQGSARYVLPAAFTTRVIATLNARSLFNLLQQRECTTEEWEFRQVAHLMHRELMKVSPTIFQYAGPPCQSQGCCPEGKQAYECGGYLGVVPMKLDGEKDRVYQLEY